MEIVIHEFLRRAEAETTTRGLALAQIANTLALVRIAEALEKQNELAEKYYTRHIEGGQV